MPFTLSHAAAVLPFSRPLARWRLLSAATIGSMVPDFRIFLPWHLQRFETHSAASLLTFCLPVGLLTYWLFQRVIKVPLQECLPGEVYARWQPFTAPADWRRLKDWLLAAIGVIAGAVTHLIWDAFTHEGARGVRMLPMLDEPWFEVGGHQWLARRFLQDVSSLLGLFLVLCLLAYAMRRGAGKLPQPSPDPRVLGAVERRGWTAAYVSCALAATLLCFVFARLTEVAPHSVTALANDIAVASLRGLALSLLLTSAVLQLRLRRAHRSSGPER